MKVSKQNAEHYIWGNICDGWHLVKNKDLSVIHERMPLNTSEIRHYHNQARQFFFVLSGTATIEINGKRTTLNTNEGIEIPPLISHQMINESNGDVEFLVISSPNSRGDRILTDK
ncbi:cupin domain-containing protein [Bacillus sp. 1NLA3E]|jgi:mannose-6-phosphate isomerase-like protein (cupin superfamily)|uniref:cupin domain-containing protein n=1 Tax=Bacillus sp. 1NLA3E TaxID=666686 RepID=UPI000247EC03|nr:cupin domain-containing protein [Bacillus sp. 1NLA3E]